MDFNESIDCLQELHFWGFYDFELHMDGFNKYYIIVLSLNEINQVVRATNICDEYATKVKLTERSRIKAS